MTKLTKAEKDWIAKVQAVLDECPSDRLGFYTIGDSNVTIYDRSKDAKIYDILDENDRMDFCSGVDKAKADTGHELMFPSNVHSTAG